MTQNKLNITWPEIFEEYDNEYQVSRIEYEAILRLTNKLFMEAIIETGFYGALPLRLGVILIQRQKPKLRPIDLKHYMQTGEKVYHKNRHSHGYMARFKWDKSLRKAWLKDRAFYEFIPIRSAKNYLAKSIKDKNTILKYMEYDKSVYFN